MEQEFGQFYQFRSYVRAKKLEIMNTPMLSMDATTKVQELKEQVENCRVWQELITGWREGLAWDEVDGQEVVTRLEREEQVVAEADFPLEAGVAELLTCPHCRVPFTKGWNQFRHRLVSCQVSKLPG